MSALGEDMDGLPPSDAYAEMFQYDQTIDYNGTPPVNMEAGTFTHPGTETEPTVAQNYGKPQGNPPGFNEGYGSVRQENYNMQDGTYDRNMSNQGWYHEEHYDRHEVYPEAQYQTPEGFDKAASDYQNQEPWHFEPNYYNKEEYNMEDYPGRHYDTPGNFQTVTEQYRRKDDSSNFDRFPNQSDNNSSSVQVFEYNHNHNGRVPEIDDFERDVHQRRYQQEHFDRNDSYPENFGEPHFSRNQATPWSQQDFSRNKASPNMFTETNMKRSFQEHQFSFSKKQCITPGPYHQNAGQSMGVSGAGGPSSWDADPHKQPAPMETGQLKFNEKKIRASNDGSKNGSTGNGQKKSTRRGGVKNRLRIRLMRSGQMMPNSEISASLMSKVCLERGVENQEEFFRKLAWLLHAGMRRMADKARVSSQQVTCYIPSVCGGTNISITDYGVKSSHEFAFKLSESKAFLFRKYKDCHYLCLTRQDLVSIFRERVVSLLKSIPSHQVKLDGFEEMCTNHYLKNGGRKILLDFEEYHVINIQELLFKLRDVITIEKTEQGKIVTLNEVYMKRERLGCRVISLLFRAQSVSMSLQQLEEAWKQRFEQDVHYPGRDFITGLLEYVQVDAEGIVRLQPMQEFARDLRQLVLKDTRSVAYRDLEDEYEKEFGRAVPVAELGGTTVLGLIQDVTHVITLQGYGGKIKVILKRTFETCMEGMNDESPTEDSNYQVPPTNTYPAEFMDTDPMLEVAFICDMVCPIKSCAEMEPKKFTSPELLEDHWNLCHWSKVAVYVCRHCGYCVYGAQFMSKHLIRKHPDSRLSQDDRGQAEQSSPPKEDVIAWWCYRQDRDSYTDPQGLWVDFDYYIRQSGKTSTLPEGCFDLILQTTVERSQVSWKEDNEFWIPFQNECPPEILEQVPGREIKFTRGMACPVTKCDPKKSKKYYSLKAMEVHWNWCHWSKTAQYVCWRCKYVDWSYKMQLHLIQAHPESEAARSKLTMKQWKDTPPFADAYPWWVVRKDSVYVDPKNLWIDFTAVLKTQGMISFLPPNCFEQSLGPQSKGSDTEKFIMPDRNEYTPELLQRDPDKEVAFEVDMRCPICVDNKQGDTEREYSSPVWLQLHWNNHHWTKTVRYLCLYCGYASDLQRMYHHLHHQHAESHAARMERKAWTDDPNTEDVGLWWLARRTVASPNKLGVWIDFEKYIDMYGLTSMLPRGYDSQEFMPDDDGTEKLTSEGSRKNMEDTQIDLIVQDYIIPGCNEYPVEWDHRDPAKEVPFTEGMMCPISECNKDSNFHRFTTPKELQSHWNNYHWSKKAQYLCNFCKFTGIGRKLNQHLKNEHPQSFTSNMSITKDNWSHPLQLGDAQVWWVERREDSLLGEKYIHPHGIWIDFDKYLAEYGLKSSLPMGSFHESLKPQKQGKKKRILIDLHSYGSKKKDEDEEKEEYVVPKYNEYPLEFVQTEPAKQLAAFWKKMQCPVKKCQGKNLPRYLTPADLEVHWNEMHWTKTVLYVCRYCRHPARASDMHLHLLDNHPHSVTHSEKIPAKLWGEAPPRKDAFMWWVDRTQKTAAIDPESTWVDFPVWLKEFCQRSLLPLGCFRDNLRPGFNDDKMSASHKWLIPDKNEYPIEFLNFDPEKEVSFAEDMLCPIPECNIDPTKRIRFTGPSDLERHFNICHWSKTLRYVCLHCEVYAGSPHEVHTHLDRHHPKSVTVQQSIPPEQWYNPPPTEDAYPWWVKRKGGVLIPTLGLWVDFAAYRKAADSFSGSYSEGPTEGSKSDPHSLPRQCFEEIYKPQPQVIINKGQKGYYEVTKINTYPLEFLEQDPAKEVAFTENMLCPVPECNLVREMGSLQRYTFPHELEMHWNTLHWSKTSLYVCRICQFASSCIEMNHHLKKEHPTSLLVIRKILEKNFVNPPPTEDTRQCWVLGKGGVRYVNSRGLWIDFPKYLKLYGDTSRLPPGSFEGSKKPDPKEEDDFYLPPRNEYPVECLMRDPAKQVIFRENMNCPVPGCNDTLRRTFATVGSLEVHWNAHHWSKNLVYVCRYCGKAYVEYTSHKHLRDMHPESVVATQKISRKMWKSPPPSEDVYFWWGVRLDKDWVMDPKGIWVDFATHYEEYGQTSFLPNSCFSDALRPHLNL